MMQQKLIYSSNNTYQVTV